MQGTRSTTERALSASPHGRRSPTHHRHRSTPKGDTPPLEPYSKRSTRYDPQPEHHFSTSVQGSSPRLSRLIAHTLDMARTLSSTSPPRDILPQLSSAPRATSHTPSTKPSSRRQRPSVLKSSRGSHLNAKRLRLIQAGAILHTLMNLSRITVPLYQHVPIILSRARAHSKSTLPISHFFSQILRQMLPQARQFTRSKA